MGEHESVDIIPEGHLFLRKGGFWTKWLTEPQPITEAQVEAALDALDRQFGTITMTEVGHLVGSTSRFVRAALEAAQAVSGPQERYTCPTPGCGGDGRYPAPGRGHLAECRFVPALRDAGHTVEIVHIETSHNPVRAETLDGREVDHYENGRIHPPVWVTIAPEQVDEIVGRLVIAEPSEQEPSMPVIAEFEHIWPYVNGRHEPCVRCGKPYGPNAGSCTVIISTTGPTDPSSGVS